jgi:hypothetical protein
MCCTVIARNRSSGVAKGLFLAHFGSSIWMIQMNEPNLDDPNAKKKYPKNTVQLYEGLHRLKSLERLQAAGWCTSSKDWYQSRNIASRSAC